MPSCQQLPASSCFHCNGSARETSVYGMEKGEDDADLTNLSWVAGTPVPLNLSVSPTRAQAKPSSGGSSSATPRFSLPLPPSALTNASMVSPVARRLPHAMSGCRLQPTAPRAQLQTSSSEKPHRSQPSKASSKSDRRKPQCSYTCLIALALKSSPTGCLPVNEIYKYIE